MPSPPLYPLIFEPIYKEKVWGGRKLERLGRRLPGGPDTLIGESWEVADLGQTSVSGGGGGAARSVVSTGPLEGRTLHDIMDNYRRDVMGDLQRTESGDFPLLVKFLDAEANLSVQVHPSEAYAASHDDAHLKSESWYILYAAPGAVIYKGVKPGVSPADFRAAIEENTVEELLIRVEVRAGDVHYLPTGTCHALGAGVLAAEVQTPSDTTFRVYDWGRVGRALHVEQAMQCITFGPPDVSRYELHGHIKGDGSTLTHLVACEHFRIDRIEADTGYTQMLEYDQPVIWMALSGGGTITTSNTPPTRFQQGQTMLLPPAMLDAKLTTSVDTIWLEVTFPQATPTRLA